LAASPAIWFDCATWRVISMMVLESSLVALATEPTLLAVWAEASLA
jgi:hypothetical protein